MRLHASSAARCSAQGDDAVLLLGPTGAGKSDLLLRLIQTGFMLVADDQVLVEDGYCAAPSALAGLLEVRGLGIFRLPFLPRARLRLVVNLGIETVRLPEPKTHPTLGVPKITLDPLHPSAPARLALALEAVTQLCGVFAP
jgi:HPr kinase/phosphorylase